MKYKYLLGSLIVVPLLPLLYFQGKKVRASVPRLPEATGNEGISGVGHPRQIKLLTIGESTMAGVGVATHQEGFTGTLATELSTAWQANVHWKVYAKSGYTAYQVGQKLLPLIGEDSADLIVVGLGGNDAFKLHNPAKWRKDMAQLIKALRQKFGDTPIFFTNMPPIKEFPAFTPLIKFSIGNLVEILGAELADLVNDMPHIYYASEKISIGEWAKRWQLEGDPSLFFSDGVHPSLLTYQTWAKDMAQFISEHVK